MEEVFVSPSKKAPLDVVFGGKRNMLFVSGGSSSIGTACCHLGDSLLAKFEIRVGDFVVIRSEQRQALCRVCPRFGFERDSIGVSECSIQKCVAEDALSGEVVGHAEALKIKVKVCAAVRVRLLWSSDEACCDVSEDLMEECVRRILNGRCIGKGFVAFARFEIQSMSLHGKKNRGAKFGVVKDTTRFSFVRDQGKENVPKPPKHSVGGLGHVVSVLEKLVVFASRMKLPPSGILLKGPPGTGKTMVVRDLCARFGIPMYVLNGGEVGGVYVGEAEQVIRNTFERAEEACKKHGCCVVFIDEIDVLCPKRQGGFSRSARIVGQMLTLMDGLKKRRVGFNVIGATNVPDAIDEALRRPGRFDREVFVSVPDKKQRRKILEAQTKTFPIKDKGNILDIIAENTVGFVGADINALCSLEMNVSGDLEISLEDFKFALSQTSASPLRAVSVEVPRVVWADLGGLGEVVSKLKKAIEWPLAFPSQLSRFNLSSPSGIVLYGPPGCGKTTLVRALASSINATFLVLSGASVYSPFVGDAEKAVRECFEMARSVSPSIVFLDELEALVGSRKDGNEGNKVQQRVLSTLLNEMDGIEALKQVIVVGATNRLDMIDEALLRPGRFGMKLEIGLPDQDARLSILKAKTRKVKVSCGVDLEEIAKKTAGKSGADLERLCSDAALLALYEDGDAKEVSMKCFRIALEKTIGK